MGDFAGSTRRERLPSNWAAIRKRVLERDRYRCQLGYRTVCTRRATQVDHIVHGDNHALSNLQAVCASCHARKTAKEGNAARYGGTRRPAEKHPGML